MQSSLIFDYCRSIWFYPDLTVSHSLSMDGSVKTLTEVVYYYDQCGEDNSFIDTDIYPLHFTDQEKKYLVAFMTSLTGVNTNG